MKLRTLPVKRKPVKRSFFRKLHAKIGGKIHPAATTADPTQVEGDIPNMNVGRALIVIALIHIVCIAGIFARKYFENKETIGQDTPPSTPKVVESLANVAADRPNGNSINSITDLPQIQPGDDRHMVLAGDTYASVARKWSINEQTLRDANNNVSIRSGLVLRVPPREAVALEPREMVELRNGAAPAPAPQRAILVRPNHNLETAPRAIPVTEEAEISVTTYQVKSGDTFYKIARDHGISAQELMRLNGIRNERALSIGQVLKIPVNVN